MKRETDRKSICELGMTSMPVRPALGRLMQQDLKFSARMGYITIPCLMKEKKINSFQWSKLVSH